MSAVARGRRHLATEHDRGRRVASPARQPARLRGARRLRRPDRAVLRAGAGAVAGRECHADAGVLRRSGDALSRSSAYYHSFPSSEAVDRQPTGPRSASPTLACILLVLLLARPSALPDEALLRLIFNWSLAFAAVCALAFPGVHAGHVAVGRVGPDDRRPASTPTTSCSRPTPCRACRSTTSRWSCRTDRCGASSRPSSCWWPAAASSPPASCSRPCWRPPGSARSA